MPDLTPLGYAQRTWALAIAELDDDSDAINLLLSDLDPVQLGDLLHAFIGQLAGRLIDWHGDRDGARAEAQRYALAVADLDDRRRAGE